MRFVDIVALYNLNGSRDIVTALELSAKGFRWEKGMKERHSKVPITFLCNLKRTVEERMHGMNCS